MANLGNYQASDEVLGDYSPVPPDNYTAVITESELLQNKNGTGSYIKLKFEIMGGEYNGRFVWNNITYQHQNNQAQEIGHKELNTLMKACGLNAVQDTTQLHGIAHVIQVKIEESEGYAPQNVVKNYYQVGADGNAAPSSSSPATPAAEPTAQQSGNAPATPDWAK